MTSRRVRPCCHSKRHFFIDVSFKPPCIPVSLMFPCVFSMCCPSFSLHVPTCRYMSLHVPYISHHFPIIPLHFSHVFWRDFPAFFHGSKASKPAVSKRFAGFAGASLVALMVALRRLVAEQRVLAKVIASHRGDHGNTICLWRKYYIYVDIYIYVRYIGKRV